MAGAQGRAKPFPSYWGVKREGARPLPPRAHFQWLEYLSTGSVPIGSTVSQQQTLEEQLTSEVQGWKDCSGIKDTWNSSREPGFGFQYPHCGLQLQATRLRWSNAVLMLLSLQAHTGVHITMRAKHPYSTYKVKIKSNRAVKMASCLNIIQSWIATWAARQRG